MTIAVEELRELLEPSPKDDGVPSLAQCERYLNGLAAKAGHCRRCDARIRASRPVKYRIRDHNGKVITTDWVLSSKYELQL
jgi:hypothetical protein